MRSDASAAAACEAGLSPSPTGQPPNRPRRYEFKQAKSKGAPGAKLLFKKRMFRETDETVTEAQFVNLSYIQAQHDYLQVGRRRRRGLLECHGGAWDGVQQGGAQGSADAAAAGRCCKRPLPGHPCMCLHTPSTLQGQYPVIREDAAQMCALQMQAEHGPTLASDAAGFEAALEKYMVKQVRGGAGWGGGGGPAGRRPRHHPALQPLPAQPSLEEPHLPPPAPVRRS